MNKTAGYFLFLIVSLLSVMRSKGAITCEYITVQGGGCPDLDACGNTCKSCYQGIGKIMGACLNKGSGQPEDECRCYFLDGAPCIPGCAHPPLFLSSLSKFMGYNNGTHFIIGPSPST